MPRLLLLTIISALWVHQSIADAEFGDTIPTETVIELISPVNTDASVFSDILADFPAFQLPAEFAVVGSIDWVTNLRVVLGTQLAEEEATEAIISTFVDEGWKVFPPQFAGAGQSGIVLPEDLTRPKFTQLCHDDQGIISVFYSERSDRNLVTLSSIPSTSVSLQRQKTCDEQIRQRTRPVTTAQSRRITMEMGKYLPNLDMPGQRPKNLLFQNSAFLTSSDNIAKRDITVDIDWSMADLYDYLAVQMADKGWELEVQTVGNVSAFGTWTRTPEANLDLVGVLTVFKAGESSFQFELKVIFPGDFIEDRN